MGLHYWGDDGVDWDSINEAARFISRNLRKWGRVCAYGKEKYGEVRIDFLYFMPLGIHNLALPGHMFNRFPGWLRKLDQILFNPQTFNRWNTKSFYKTKTAKVFNLFIRFYYLVVLNLPNRIWHKYQKFVYKAVYKKALKKWPNIAVEILSGCDHLELIKGSDRWIKVIKKEDRIYQHVIVDKEWLERFSSKDEGWGDDCESS